MRSQSLSLIRSAENLQRSPVSSPTENQMFLKLMSCFTEVGAYVNALFCDYHTMNSPNSSLNSYRVGFDSLHCLPTFDLSPNMVVLI